MNSIFVQLAIILGLSSIFGYLIRKLYLPLIIAYLLVGVFVVAVTNIHLPSTVSILPDIGLAFVLFLTGMELDFREIRSFGKPIIITSLIQVVLSAIAGATIARAFGLPSLQAQYLGVGLSFSSTIVVVKLLLDRRGLNSLYGKLSIGITLLEDLIAVVILMILSMGHLNFLIENPLILTSFIVKGVVLLLLLFMLAKYVLPHIFKSVSGSTELLFLTSLAWCFLFVSLTTGFGFSVVIGAFLAGIALASSPFHYHISGRIKPLRDFSVVLFFVFLGTQVSLTDLQANLGLILSFVGYALIVKPLIFLLTLGQFGFRKHTIFQAAFSLSQISEFSLVIILFGIRSGVLPQSALSVMALSMTLSIIISSAILSQSTSVYRFIRPMLSFFERKDLISQYESRVTETLADHVVVIGGGRLGGPIIEFLKKKEIPFIVLDFNPEIVESLQKHSIRSIYGDLGDSEVLDNLSLEKARLVISSAIDADDNKILLSELKSRESKARVVVRVSDEEEEAGLKKRGADYVLLPESVSADFIIDQLKSWPEVDFRELKS